MVRGQKSPACPQRARLPCVLGRRSSKNTTDRFLMNVSSKIKIFRFPSVPSREIHLWFVGRNPQRAHSVRACRVCLGEDHNMWILMHVSRTTQFSGFAVVRPQCLPSKSLVPAGTAHPWKTAPTPPFSSCLPSKSLVPGVRPTLGRQPPTPPFS